MNFDPRSEDTWGGMPCFENTWETNSPATSEAVLVSVVRMKRHYLDTRSITTRIAVKPLDVDKYSTKPILIECHGRPGTGKGCSEP